VPQGARFKIEAHRARIDFTVAIHLGHRGRIIAVYFDAPIAETACLPERVHDAAQPGVGTIR
jgi:hypothetical protein